jgi:hypothetical protein
LVNQDDSGLITFSKNVKSGDKENYEAQFYAFKMAAQFSGHRPYELKVDNQGGHKKLKSSSFLDKIARLSLNTKPYNGRSKTIESAFGRFQSRYMKPYWFFTGQNITAKKLESKNNTDLINANKSNLPTLDEVKALYKELREKWNNAKHPNFDKTRLELYNESVNPATPELHVWDMIDMFWVLKDKPTTCFAYGISFRLDNIKYDYVVYENNGKQGYERDINIEWIARNIGTKFYIKYDPTDMGLIYLYTKAADGSLIFVTEAETKMAPHRNVQEQDEWEAKFYSKVQQASDNLRLKLRDEMEEYLSVQKMSTNDYGLNAPKLQGLETGKQFKNKQKKEAEKAKAENKAAEKAWKDAQDVDKVTSNVVVLDEESEANFDAMTEFIDLI